MPLMLPGEQQAAIAPLGPRAAIPESLLCPPPSRGVKLVSTNTQWASQHPLQTHIRWVVPSLKDHPSVPKTRELHGNDGEIAIITDNIPQLKKILNYPSTKRISCSLTLTQPA